MTTDERRAAELLEHQPASETPSGSFIIGGPGTKVGRASIKESYSDDPEGFGGIYGDEIEDASMERNIHDPEQREDQE